MSIKLDELINQPLFVKLKVVYLHMEGSGKKIPMFTSELL